MIIASNAMSAQIEARKNKMIVELTSLKIECSLWKRSQIYLNQEYQRKLLETFQSTNEKIANRTKTTSGVAKIEEPVETKFKIIEECGVRYYVNRDNDVFDKDKFYVGFWIPREDSLFFEDDDDDEDDEDEDEDDEEYDEETVIKAPGHTGPKQPANPLGLSLEFPNIAQEDDEDILFAKYEQELDQEMLMMKEKVIGFDKLYARRISKLDKRIHSLKTRMVELESMIVKFGSKISNMKMKKIKELDEMANSVWMHR